MTRKRYDDHSTEFGLWLRKQKPIDSKLGFVTTNIDYVWRNYETKEWMLIEEKRHKSSLTFSQKQTFDAIHCAINDDNYKGFFILTFENTSVENGKIWLQRFNDNDPDEDEREITEDQLLKFLLFDWPIFPSLEEKLYNCEECRHKHPTRFNHCGITNFPFHKTICLKDYWRRNKNGIRKVWPKIW